MGRAVTLGTLKERIRQQLDLPAFSSSTFVSTATVEAMVNESLQTYYALLQDADAEEWYTYVHPVSTTPGQAFLDVADRATLSLPADFVGVRALYWARDADTLPVKLTRANSDGWGYQAMPARSWDGYAPTYSVMRGRIFLFPTPSEAYSLQLWFVGSPPDLSGDSASFDGGPGWAEFVTADVCAKIRDKENDAHDWLAKRELVEARIRSQLQRDRAEADTIRRVFDARSMSTRERFDRATYEG